MRVVVVGAGIGGLTTAAVLAKAGLDVTVLEAHVYAGGSAGTFYHKGYRFDAGATLAAGFYPNGPMDLVAKATGIESWPVRAEPLSPAMVVHLPDGAQIPRYGDERRRTVHADMFGLYSDRFFAWQEATADLLWDFALRTPAWPPQSLGDGLALTRISAKWLLESVPESIPHLPSLLLDALRPASAHLRGAPERLRTFIDAQLLISAQTTSENANALYAASALDLPRRGVAHPERGIGAIAETLVDAVRAQGGEVRYRSEVIQIKRKERGEFELSFKHREAIRADVVILNLPVWNICELMKDDSPSAIRRAASAPRAGWGAFTLYIGFDGRTLAADFPLHHQIIRGIPLGEGNSAFLSISPEWDQSRAPQGHRVITMSTHTTLEDWWRLSKEDSDAYETQKAEYTERMLDAAEVMLPNLRAEARLILPGTPVTFQRFTRRAMGWVGGFPQTSLFGTLGPRLDRNVWMVGDSIFPGQSIPGVALGGMRVARAVLQSL